MANRRDTFAKRQREADLKARARAKQERRLTKRTEVRPNKGPEIMDLEAAHAIVFGGDAPPDPAPGPPAVEGEPDPPDPTE